MSLGQAGLLVIPDALLVSKVWGANRREDVSFEYLFSDAWNSDLREQSTILTSSMPAATGKHSAVALLGESSALGRIKAASEVLVVTKLVVCCGGIADHHPRCWSRKDIDSSGSCMID